MSNGSETPLYLPSDKSNGKGKNSTGKTGLLARLDRLIDRFQWTINIATCFMFVTTLVITGIIASQAPADNSQMGFPELCIDCTQLTRNLPTQPEVGEFIRRLEDGSEMCCAETPEQISALLRASMRKKVADSDPEPQANFLPVSAHKRLLPVYDNEYLLQEPRYIADSTEHFPAKFNTTFDHPVTEHAHGVEVLDTAFRINYTGLFLVYLSIHIEPVFNKTLDTKLKAWTQYVYRESRNNSAKSGNLLQSAYTAEGESTDHHETLYIAGTFHLDKGDVLQVALNPIGVFRYKPEFSFLGVVLLNSGPV